MRKSITILDVQREISRDNLTSLRNRIAERRLACRQAVFVKEPKALEWLSTEKAMHNLRAAGPQPAEWCSVFEESVPKKEPIITDHPEYPVTIDFSEKAKIEKWLSERATKSLRGHKLPTNMNSDERKYVTEAADEMSAVYLTEHEIDVAFSAVHADFPWLAALTERAWKQSRRQALSGLPAGVGPLLILGPPGVGKSSWSRAVADGLGLPRLDVDVGATGGVMDLQGTGKGWGSADKGRLMSTLLSSRIANPLVTLDEIDSGGRSAGTSRGTMPGLFKVLMGLIEPSTAESWVCPFYQVPVNMRHVSWIATCNTVRDIEQALLDRMTVIDLPDMTNAQLLAFAAKQARVRFGDDFADVVVDRVRDSLRRGNRLSLRHVVKVLNKVEEALNRPILN